MTHSQTLVDYATTLPTPVAERLPNEGYFAALPLDSFSAESLAASAIYCRRDFYKIMLVTGDATYHSSDQAFPIQPGHYLLVFTNRQVPYRWQVHSGVCHGYSCVFTEEFLPPRSSLPPTGWTVFEPDGPAVFHLSAAQAQPFIDLYQKMLAQQRAPYRYNHELLLLYVLECLHLALQLVPEPAATASTAAARLTDSFRALLASQFPLVAPTQRVHWRTAQAVADQLAVHVNYLNRTLKAVTGRTTTQLLTERLLQEARALLLHTDWSIGQISESLGFDEPTHFAQVFRRHTHLTPSAFRRQV